VKDNVIPRFLALDGEHVVFVTQHPCNRWTERERQRNFVLVRSPPRKPDCWEIRRVGKQGGQPETLVKLRPNVWVGGLAVSSLGVVCSEAAEVKLWPRDRGPVRTLFAVPRRVHHLASDGQNIYAVDGDYLGAPEQAALVRWDGRTLSTLGDASTTSANSVAFTRRATVWASGGEVRKSEGGKVTRLARGVGRSVHIAADETQVDVADYQDGTLRVVPLAGGALTMLARPADKTDHVVLDGTTLWFTALETARAQSALWRLTK
jgi:hypothetical protein